MNEARKEVHDREQVKALALEKMNLVIREFLSELDKRMPHKYQPFLFDPSSMEYFWDTNNLQLYENLDQESTMDVYCVADGAQFIKQFMQRNYNIYRKRDFYFNLAKQIFNTCDKYVNNLAPKQKPEEQKNWLEKHIQTELGRLR